ncbi:MAG: hypothetical protein IM658_12605 [Phenylobacterium sp.]|jgi:hypothetical protein|uniref:hypothetical protein n=1 Tax=Phenylobacterium sp. TaxID=1871053 RepID=UPI0025DA360B|nr:hypothetical protein [Phenylobacterium sp.]MCA3725462.1 hypothetical protein [Phenylobacterium sp.]MCA3734817.1 hypothetical protein [Phenylobacterium sp.]MCA3744876.1 hypothetical protein [Phenylobacterium sp.]MCA6278150.1 hypothetical protein [Phenylobacterium sp.]MCA6284504.1 hypothetical protein [Phenylobacterium sp.]
MGKKKTKTSSTETSRTVTTPIRPDWVDAQARGLNEALTDLGRRDPAASVAPVSDLERRASEGAAGLGVGAGWGGGGTDWTNWGRTPPEPSGATLAGRGEVPQAASVLDNLSSYMTPFRDQVLNAAMDDYDAEAGRRRAAQDLELAGQGAFGGSGAALTRSLTEGELARGRNSRLAGLLDQMFTQGSGLASGDADRRQQASTAAAQLAQARDLERARLSQAAEAGRMQDALARAQLGQEGELARSRLGLDEAASRRADAETQARIGAQARAVEQARLSAPEQALARRIEMFSGLPLGLFQGSETNSQGQRTGTETTSGGTLGEIASLVNSLTGSPLSRLFPGGGR